MLKEYSQAVTSVYPRANQAPVINRNMFKLQDTSVEPDKSDFESLQYVLNCIHKGANAIARNGYLSLGTVDDLLSIDIHETETENFLYAVAKDGGSDSKVVRVDRSTGSGTDIATGFSGQGTPDSTSLSNWFYLVNETDLYRVQDDGTNATMNIPSETPKLITNDGSRLWIVYDTADGEVLRFSEKSLTGNIANLTSTSSTLLNRAGVAESNIAKFTALEKSGSTVIACGENQTELFKIPDFGGVTEFTADVPVRIASFPNIGVKGRKAVITIGSYAFLKPADDGLLHRINMTTGATKVYSENLRQMEGLSFDNCTLGYNQRLNLLLIGCRDSENNDRVVAFNIQEENFSIFDNIYPSEFTGDADNIYFYDNDTIYDAFGETMYTDDGLPINIKVRTQATDFGSYYNSKKLHEYYFNAEYNEDLTVDISIYADRAVNGQFSPTTTQELNLARSNQNLGQYGQSFGLGVWGGAGVSFEETTTESVFTNNKVFVTGNRFELEIATEVSQPFSVRGLGISGIMLPKRTKNVTYST